MLDFVLLLYIPRYFNRGCFQNRTNNIDPIYQTKVFFMRVFYVYAYFDLFTNFLVLFNFFGYLSYMCNEVVISHIFRQFMDTKTKGKRLKKRTTTI